MLLNNLNREMFKPFVLIDVCLVDLLVACVRICTSFKGVSFRETHLRELFGRTEKLLS